MFHLTPEGVRLSCDWCGHAIWPLSEGTFLIGNDNILRPLHGDCKDANAYGMPERSIGSVVLELRRQRLDEGDYGC